MQGSVVTFIQRNVICKPVSSSLNVHIHMFTCMHAHVHIYTCIYIQLMPSAKVRCGVDLTLLRRLIRSIVQPEVFIALHT